MSVLSKLEVVRTHKEFPSMTPAVAYAVTSQPLHCTKAPLREYSLICTIGTSFVANDEAYAEARNDAERMLHVGIFRDIIPLVYKCKDAVRAGDELLANGLLVDILDIMNGGG